MTEAIDTVIIGGGQAGLSVSACLARRGREHVVLERADQIAPAWRHQRWDSFTLVTPNWMIRLPDGAYDGPDPEAFLDRDAVVAYLDDYAARHELPVRTGCAVTRVAPRAEGFRIDTSLGVLDAANVVVATGTFQKPRLPACHAALPADVAQAHSSQYRNPRALPPGAVLVVGTAQSGAQIAEELHEAGRRVYLSVGSAGRVPRRYRGVDIMTWYQRLGRLDRTVDRLPSPRARFAGNPHVSGKNGGHSINLHKLAAEGVTLVGRVSGASAGCISFAPDLKENLARIDRFEADLLKEIDAYVERHDLGLPSEQVVDRREGYDQIDLADLDLAAAGVTSVIWATGYTYDFSYIEFAVLDADGYPVQQRGISPVPGLYFVGLSWLHTAKSVLLYGVGEDAAHVAEWIVTRRPRARSS